MKEQSNAYRSQRCSSCGFVHVSNRQGKTFLCGQCGFRADADYNAALNHRADIPEIVRDRCLPNKTIGFYWKTIGLFGSDGVEFTVPLAYKSKIP